MYKYLIYRLEKIIFGEPSDIIDNLNRSDKATTEEVDKSVDIDNEKGTDDISNQDSDQGKSDCEPSNVSEDEDAKSEGKKAAWQDDDDCNYTYVYNRISCFFDKKII